jgi:hypothetical protein
LENNIILLNKDGSIKVTKKEKNIFKYNPKYILIPISCTDNISFIMIKNKKLLDFTYANVKINMVYNLNYDEEEIYFNTIEKSISSIVEFINFIHSINRIDYMNTILNYTLTDDAMHIKISEISISLFKDNDNILSLKLKDFDNNYQIIGYLKDVYEPVNNNLIVDSEYYDYVSIKDNKWKFTNKLIPGSIIGLNLALSQSIYFINCEEFKYIKNHIKNISYNGYIFNIKEINELIRDEDLFESEETNFENYCYRSINGNFRGVEGTIEFLMYINYLYNTVILVYNDILYGCEWSRDNKYIGFDIYLTANINCNRYINDSIVEVFRYNTMTQPTDIISKIINKMY